jgi:hypothetical protein
MGGRRRPIGAAALLQTSSPPESVVRRATREWPTLASTLQKKWDSAALELLSYTESCQIAMVVGCPTGAGPGCAAGGGLPASRPRPHGTPAQCEMAKQSC